MTTQEIIDVLTSFNPFTEDDPENDNESFFYNPMEELITKEDFYLAIEPIFKLIEKYPSVDFGSPGPIVHTLESFVGHYEDYLFESLKRKPAPLTVWMYNRIINAEQNLIIKQNLIERLQSLLLHPLIDKATIETIRNFLQFQNKNV